MYLKGVEIYGFKSFGERIKIDFQGGITSIVGPNGSGKSNILDAILWVLGEQSYKNIRAKESKDIVFSGGEKKKSANSAEVSLFIDNRDRFFQLDEEEVKITRKLHMSGQNEYFINDKRVRLKDINELFMDTGVGKSAYSVIGQGKVERIISSSKKEVKEIIEEAAGVKKFQQRKTESEKNLENVALELEKIELILNETRDNRDKIKKQADRAEAFLELKKERDSISKGINIFELDRNRNNLKNSEERIAKLKETALAIKATKESNNKELESIVLERENLKKSIEENFNKNEELKNIINSFEREKVKLSERIEAYQREEKDRQERLLSSEERDNKNEEYIESINKEKQDLEKEVNESEKEFKGFESEISGKEKSKKDLEKDIEFKKREILDFEVTKLQYVNDIESSSRRFKGSNSKINSLKEEIEETNKKIDENKELLAKATKDLEEKNNQLKDVAKRQIEIEKSISQISIDSNKISETLRRDESEEHRNRVKYESILRFEENNDGFFRGVKEILNLNIPGVAGAFVSLIQIPEYLENAIQAAIPGNLQDIVVKDNITAKKCIEILKQRKVGRASFLALDMIKTFKKKDIPNIPGVVGRGSELIGFDKKYQKIVDMILGSLLVVENIDIAIEITKKNLYFGNIVTLTGELISGSGRITGGEGKKTAISQMFERRKEMKRLEGELKIQTARINENRQKLDDYSKKLESLENEVYQIDVREENLKKSIRTASEDCDTLKQKEDKLVKNKNMFVLEKEEEEQYSKEYQKRIENSSKNKENIEKQTVELKASIEENTKIVQKLDEEIKALNDSFSDMKIRFLNSKDRLIQIDSELLRNDTVKKEIKDEINSIKESLVKISAEIKRSQALLKETEDEKEKKEYQYEKENRELHMAREREGLLEIREKEVTSSIRDNDSDEFRNSEKLKSEEDKKITFETRINTYLEELESLNEVVAKEIREINHRENVDRVRNLTNRLKNFETVNLLAVEEFKELDKRYKFIKTQKEDLEESKTSLINIIDEISVAIKERFYDAYRSINENFNMMCMETIDNSEGSLVLSNEEDYENCGVEIYVKFKNKKKQSLTLLSGGEKSMVAIAFIMSIFMYKPSPFTFLDEIEAALDEKNTRKLINKLKEFTDKSQFILITHNKETMKSSDTLFGVTMNKKIGISKIVSVKL